MRNILILLLVIAISGCGWLRHPFGGGAPVEPPTKLTDIQPTLNIRSLWSTRVGSGFGKRYVRVSPAVSDGRVYAADGKGRVAALDAGSGTTIWETDADVPLSAGVGVGAGLALVGTSNGEVVALDADDGTIRWRVRLTSEVLSAPQASGGVVVVRAVDGRLFGLDAANGARLWVYQGNVPVLTLRGTSTPALAGGAVISGFDSGKVVELALADGRVVWEQTVAVPHGRSELDRMVDVDADPRVYAGVVYVVSYQGRIAALDVASGNVFWTRDVSSYAGLGVGSGAVYVSDAHSDVWALDRMTGASIWKQDALHNRAVTAPGVLDESVVVGDLEGYLHWLARDDGQIQARYRADSAGILAAPVVSNDTVYVLGEGGHLTALRVSPLTAP